MLMRSIATRCAPDGFTRSLLMVAVATLVSLAISSGAVFAAATVYASPQQALQAFRDAVEGKDGKGLIDLFGKDYEVDLIGGDPAGARQTLQTLRRMAAEGMRLTPMGTDRMTIVMGRRGWPMPIPLKKTEAGWVFDLKEGLEEIADRRIGRNELAAIEFCRVFIDAQRLYATVDHDGDLVLEFAQRFQSQNGQRDGLYWKPGADGVISPLGPFAAAAESSLEFRKAGEPFRGYYFRILTQQGGNAPGGAYNYIINGNMIAGFALIAWPADYGRSGIMTFLCGHNGQILEKDLGSDTGRIASAIVSFDPDKSWLPAQ
jgi:hypothetical protein